MFSDKKSSSLETTVWNDILVKCSHRLYSKNWETKAGRAVKKKPNNNTHKIMLPITHAVQIVAAIPNHWNWKASHQILWTPSIYLPPLLPLQGSLVLKVEWGWVSVIVSAKHPNTGDGPTLALFLNKKKITQKHWNKTNTYQKIGFKFINKL